MRKPTQEEAKEFFGIIDVNWLTMDKETREVYVSEIMERFAGTWERMLDNAMETKWEHFDTVTREGGRLYVAVLKILGQARRADVARSFSLWDDLPNEFELSAWLKKNR